MSATNELARLLVNLGRAGCELAPHPTDPARLRHRPAVLSPDLSARLRTHKGAVLAMLANGYSPADDDAAHVLGERLGVADDLDMPTHPGSPAWSIALGEAMGGATPAPAASLADRLASIVGTVLCAPVRASTLPPGARFPGEPKWESPAISTKRRK